MLRNSVSQPRHQPYRFAAGARALSVFFRDDRLSDLIGFEYARWNSHDAAANLIAELEGIETAASDESPVVGIMLDGENCWERYAYNGYYFLTALYGALQAHPRIRTATCSQCLASLAAPPPALERVTAGSWVQGDLRTWIGAPEKNRAWDLLCSAKQTFDVVIASGRLDAAQTAAAFRQLGACEASDAFWWLGSANGQATLAAFDALFRRQLARLYRLLNLPVPAALSQPITQHEAREQQKDLTMEGSAPGALRQAARAARPG